MCCVLCLVSLGRFDFCPEDCIVGREKRLSLESSVPLDVRNKCNYYMTGLCHGKVMVGDVVYTHNAKVYTQEVYLYDLIG